MVDKILEPAGDAVLEWHLPASHFPLTEGLLVLFLTDPPIFALLRFYRENGRRCKEETLL